MPAAQRAADLHPVPDLGAGEGVPLQPLPHPTAAHRNRSRVMPHGEADKNMVSKQADEAQKGTESSEGDK